MVRAVFATMLRDDSVKAGMGDRLRFGECVCSQ